MFRLSPVVKNLLILNVAVYILQYVLSGIGFTEFISLWPVTSEYWKPFQFLSYMFAHSTDDIYHILFNMLGLVFIGPLLEQFWGPKRFLIFYLVTGIGAGLLYNGIKYYDTYQIERDVNAFLAEPSPSQFVGFLDQHIDYGSNSRGTPYEMLFRTRYSLDQVIGWSERYDENPEDQQVLNNIKSFMKDKVYVEETFGIMLGASGAIYGLLMAIGLLFPNTQFMLLFPPIPIKAKYITMIAGGMVIYSLFNQSPDDRVAHLAHLGGMIFAFIMIKYWQSKRDKFY